MTDPWVAEKELTEALARRLINEQFPELSASNIEPIGAGWDNTAYRVDDTWLFRFPRRQVAVPAIETECAVLPRIASPLPLTVPNPQFVGQPSDLFPWPFAGYRWIAGQTACVANLSDEERSAAAPPLASFLRTLHALPVPAGAPADTLRRFDLELRNRYIEERLESAKKAGLVRADQPLLRILEDVPADWSPSETTLVHGDLYVRHIVVNVQREVSAIIDWGDVHAGEPAGDLSIAWSFLGAARDRFREAYGDIDDESWHMARYRALLYGVTLAVFGDRTSDEALVREAQRILRNVSEA